MLRSRTRTNLIAIAVPAGGRGAYFRHRLGQILTTVYTGFTAAMTESWRLWPCAPVEVRTGVWGCDAFDDAWGVSDAMPTPLSAQGFAPSFSSIFTALVFFGSSSSDFL